MSTTYLFALAFQNLHGVSVADTLRGVMVWNICGTKHIIQPENVDAFEKDCIRVAQLPWVERHAQALTKDRTAEAVKAWQFEGLLNGEQVADSVANFVVPLFVVVVEIFRADDFAATRFSTDQGHGVIEVEDAVFVGNLFSFFNFSDSDLKTVAGADGVAVAAMVDVFGKIPANNPVALLIDVRILLNDFLHLWCMQ